MATRRLVRAAREQGRRYAGRERGGLCLHAPIKKRVVWVMGGIDAEGARAWVCHHLLLTRIGRHDKRLLFIFLFAFGYGFGRSRS